MLYLTPHVYCVQVDSQLVFLDLEGDRYHSLGPLESHGVHTALFEASEDVGDGLDATVQTLVDANLVTDDPRRGKRAKAIRPPVLSGDLMGYPIGVEPEIRASHLFQLARAASMTSLRLRATSLATIATRIRSRKERQVGQRSATTPTALVEVFKRLRPLLFTAKNQCLYDSLVLVEFLASHGFFPSWVMAVKMGPFSAHSWLQADGIVYNDEVANVARFIPIMTL